jgi:hypothetical protein
MPLALPLRMKRAEAILFLVSPAAHRLWDDDDPDATAT